MQYTLLWAGMGYPIQIQKKLENMTRSGGYRIICMLSKGLEVQLTFTVIIVPRKIN